MKISKSISLFSLVVTVLPWALPETAIAQLFYDKTQPVKVETIAPIQILNSKNSQNSTVQRIQSVLAADSTFQLNLNNQLRSFQLSEEQMARIRPFVIDFMAKKEFVGMPYTPPIKTVLINDPESKLLAVKRMNLSSKGSINSRILEKLNAGGDQSILQKSAKTDLPGLISNHPASGIGNSIYASYDITEKEYKCTMTKIAASCPEGSTCVVGRASLPTTFLDRYENTPCQELIGASELQRVFAAYAPQIEVNDELASAENQCIQWDAADNCTARVKDIQANLGSLTPYKPEEEGGLRYISPEKMGALLNKNEPVKIEGAVRVPASTLNKINLLNNQ
jgi:hypothetical protein